MAEENSSGVQIQIQPLTKCVTLSNVLGFSELQGPVPRCCGMGYSGVFLPGSFDKNYSLWTSQGAITGTE